MAIKGSFRVTSGNWSYVADILDWRGNILIHCLRCIPKQQIFRPVPHIYGANGTAETRNLLLEKLNYTADLIFEWQKLLGEAVVGMRLFPAGRERLVGVLRCDNYPD